MAPWVLAFPQRFDAARVPLNGNVSATYVTLATYFTLLYSRHARDCLASAYQKLTLFGSGVLYSFLVDDVT